MDTFDADHFWRKDKLVPLFSQSEIEKCIIIIEKCLLYHIKQYIYSLIAFEIVSGKRKVYLFV